MLTAINLPSGPIDIPSAWRGEDMAAKPDRWLVRLTAGEIAELEQAAKSYLATTREIGGITKETFSTAGFRRSPVAAEGEADPRHRL